MDNSMARGEQSNVKLRNANPPPSTVPPPNLSQTTGIAQFYAKLIDHPDFKADFRARVTKHFGAGGVLGPEVAGENPGSTLFQEKADEFEPFARAESARWGDPGITDPGITTYFFDSPSITGTDGGDWLSNIQYRTDTWIPARRIALVQALYTENLADPANHTDIPLP